MHTFTYGGQNGQTYNLTEAPDLVVVRTTGGALIDHPMSSTSRDLMPHLIPITSFPEVDVTVYRVVCGDDQSAVQIRNNLRQSLSEEGFVRFAGRVLRDQKTGTIFVYTENIFVQFAPEHSGEDCRTILDKYGLKVKEKLVFADNAFFAKAPEGTGMKVFTIANDLLKRDDVLHCHPELVREKKHKAQVVHPMQWHLRYTNINGQPIDEHVDVDAAWQIHRGEGTTIAVIDDGVDDTHEEFSTPGKVVFPRNTVNDSDAARPIYSRDNHGTACAGVACAAGSRKASGVAPQARLMPIRSGGLGSLAEAKAFAWAADKGADVISCSWGPMDGDWSNPDDPTHTHAFALPDSTRLAIDYACRSGRAGKGCVIVWAAGNGNENVRFDGYASYSKVIAVAACNDQGRRSVYSDYGDAVWCSFPSNDFYAPQFNHPHPLTPGIWTTDRSGGEGYNRGGVNAEGSYGDVAGNYTARFGGTSSSCPGVAGVAALMLGVNPELTWQQVKTLIRQSCDRIDEPFGAYDEYGHSIFYGYGRLNAGKAVQNAQSIANQPEDVGVEGVAYFNYASAVRIEEGQMTSDVYLFNRLVGLRLQLKPLCPGLGIRYRVFIHRIGPSRWAEDGSFTGTSDRRRKLVGIQIELTGPLAQKYSVKYAAKLYNRDGLITGQDGSVAGTDSALGAAISEIQVSVNPR